MPTIKFLPLLYHVARVLESLAAQSRGSIKKAESDGPYLRQTQLVSCMAAKLHDALFSLLSKPREDEGKVVVSLGPQNSPPAACFD
jgi:hypothetical protein